MPKRFCNNARDWLRVYFNEEKWQKIEMEIPSYHTLQDDLISNEHVLINGIKWNVLLQPTPTKIGISLQASLDGDDDGSHWKCTANMKLTVLSNLKQYPNIVKDVLGLTWSRESTTKLFQTSLINKKNDAFRQIYSDAGTVKFNVQFLPQNPTGIYTPYQRKMKSTLEEGIDTDMDLVPKQEVIQERMLIPCQSKVLKSLAGSPVLKEAIDKRQSGQGDQNLQEGHIERIELALDLTPQAIQCLLEFIYFEKDYDILQSPPLAYDLFKFSLEYKMVKLTDCCLGAFCSRKFQENAEEFHVDVALDLYLAGAIYMGRRVNKIIDETDGVMTIERCSRLTRSMVKILHRKNLKEGGNAQALANFSHVHPPLAQALEIELEERMEEESGIVNGIPILHFMGIYSTSYINSYDASCNRTTSSATISYKKTANFFSTVSGAYHFSKSYAGPPHQ